MAQETTREKQRREPTEQQREAARRQIRTVGDPVLRETAAPVTVFDDSLAQLAERMLRIMRDAPGIGLAAPQIGVVKRLIVYGTDDEPRVLANPEVTWRSDEVEAGDEGCLSVPGVTVPVERAVRVRVHADDLRGAPLDLEAEGLEARVIQHEIDHLLGALILERTSRKERARALRELRETEFPY
jgi:peptide deformylase